MSRLLPLMEASDTRGTVAVWRTSRPFIENSRAVLIHRPRSVHQYKLARWPGHIAVHYWCGNGTTGGKNVAFLDVPPDNKLLCAICETRATMAGMPSAFALVGRHVHVGRVVAQQTCCGHRLPESESVGSSSSEK